MNSQLKCIFILMLASACVNNNHTGDNSVSIHKSWRFRKNYSIQKFANSDSGKIIMIDDVLDFTNKDTLNFIDNTHNFSSFYPYKMQGDMIFLKIKGRVIVYKILKLSNTELNICKYEEYKTVKKNQHVLFYEAIQK